MKGSVAELSKVLLFREEKPLSEQPGLDTFLKQFVTVSMQWDKYGLCEERRPCQPVKVTIAIDKASLKPINFIHIRLGAYVSDAKVTLVTLVQMNVHSSLVVAVQKEDLDA